MKKEKCIVVVSLLFLFLILIMTWYFIYSINLISWKIDADKHVSLSQVIVNPQKYDKKEISVVGIHRSEFEGHALFMNLESYKMYEPSNSIWAIREIPQELGGTNTDDYIIIEGTYYSEEKGHFGGFSGSLKNHVLHEKYKTECD